MLNSSVSELEHAATAAAWPLVRLAQPELDGERWQQKAQALRLRGGGVVGLIVENGTLMGVATYEPVEKPMFGRVLQVSLFVTAEVSRRAPLRRLLMEGLREKAAALGCSETLVAAAKRPPPQSPPKRPLTGAKPKRAA
jgi:hypothetical protein